LPGGVPNANWIDSPPNKWSWLSRYTWYRWRNGDLTFLRDRSLARWAQGELQGLRPQSCYLFTQVALEVLRWARAEGILTALENPNGHIRNFREICERESQRWFGKRFLGHPSPGMVDRVEEEYHLADRIRVYADWGKKSMTRYGVPGGKISATHQSIDLERFRPAPAKAAQAGPLRICYAGSMDLRKGFVYLLRAMRLVGAKHFQLRIAGATGDRDSAQLFAREKAGLQVECEPGDTLKIYQESELFVLPTLEDGLGYVTLESMACGLPAIVTDQAGSAECVQPGSNGWVVPAAEVEPLAEALEEALLRRQDLRGMGQQARVDIENYAAPFRLRELSAWFCSPSTVEACS
jgi:glycosyltransferase involved in cell wall biosynthesis